MKTISLCMIVKNEEEVLFDCLNSIKEVVDEIIIVDTGSNDNTKNIAKKFTDKIYDFIWCNDFSAARNFAISKVKSEYVMMVDSDETLKDWDKKTFERLIKEHPKGVGCIRKENLLSEDGKDYTICDEPRMFPKNYAKLYYGKCGSYEPAVYRLKQV